MVKNLVCFGAGVTCLVLAGLFGCDLSEQRSDVAELRRAVPDGTRVIRFIWTNLRGSPNSCSEFQVDGEVYGEYTHQTHWTVEPVVMNEARNLGLEFDGELHSRGSCTIIRLAPRP